MRKRIQLDNTTIHLEECGSLVHDLSLPENKSPGRSAEVDSESAVLPSSQTASFEYHIVYHPSYRVPVLYFNAFDQGRPCLADHSRHGVPLGKLQDMVER